MVPALAQRRPKPLPHVQRTVPTVESGNCAWRTVLPVAVAPPSTPDDPAIGLPPPIDADPRNHVHRFLCLFVHVCRIGRSRTATASGCTVWHRKMTQPWEP